jgi:hypothetical protein
MWEIEYAYNNWKRTVWVPHLSKWIHSIHAKGPREVTRGGVNESLIKILL